MSLRETVFDRDVLALNIASFAQTLPKSSEQMRNPRSRHTVKAPDHWYRWPRSCGERPSRCRSTADKGDELAPLHVSSREHTLCGAQSLALCDRAASSKLYKISLGF
jgi:hypothetical protein